MALVLIWNKKLNLAHKWLKNLEIYNLQLIILKNAKSLRSRAHVQSYTPSPPPPLLGKDAVYQIQI